MDNYQDDKMVNWAEQNFPDARVVKKFDYALFLMIVLSPFFGCSVFSLINSISRPGKDGTMFFLAVIMTGASVGVLIYLFGLRRRMVVYMDSNGVKTRAGKFYQWANLCFIDLAPVGQRTPSGSVTSSRERYRMELNFEDGIAVLTGITELTTLLEGAPVEINDRRGQWTLK